MMPLQQLMQHDAVEEAAKAESEEDAGRDRKALARIPAVHGTLPHEPVSVDAHVPEGPS
jgi:hypothetical protein